MFILCTRQQECPSHHIRPVTKIESTSKFKQMIDLITSLDRLVYTFCGGVESESGDVYSERGRQMNNTVCFIAIRHSLFKKKININPLSNQNVECFYDPLYTLYTFSLMLDKDMERDWFYSRSY